MYEAYVNEIGQFTENSQWIFLGDPVYKCYNLTWNSSVFEGKQYMVE